jgi:hypothetical protein
VPSGGKEKEKHGEHADFPGRLRGTLDGFHFHHVQYFSRSSELNPGAVSYLHTHTHAPFDHVSSGACHEGNAGGRAWTPYFYPHGASPELPFCFDSASPLVVEPNGGAFRGDGEVPGQEVIAAGAGQGSAGMIVAAAASLLAARALQKSRY